MKSFRESFGLSKGVSALEFPKSAAGILSHQEDVALSTVWIEISKTAEAFSRLSKEIKSYKDAIHDVHESEEKLLKALGDSGIGSFCPAIRIALDEYLSVVMELRPKDTDDESHLHDVMLNPVRQYQGLYEHLDAVRKRRDAHLTEVERCQEKFDRLKLKLKRTTDVFVEKQKAMKQLKEINSQLVQNATTFHTLRISFMQNCLHAYAKAQIDYYGSAASSYSSHIQESRGYHLMKESEYQSRMGEHLKGIKQLRIVGT